MLSSKLKSKIHSMPDDQLPDILRFDFETSPVIPIDQINDYLHSMTEEEKLWQVLIFQVMDELVSRREKTSKLRVPPFPLFELLDKPV